jgi:hypothetical protein
MSVAAATSLKNTFLKIAMISFSDLTSNPALNPALMVDEKDLCMLQ